MIKLLPDGKENNTARQRPGRRVSSPRLRGRWRDLFGGCAAEWRENGHFDWRGDRLKPIPKEKLILYEMHIGTFNSAAPKLGDPKRSDREIPGEMSGERRLHVDYGGW